MGRLASKANRLFHRTLDLVLRVDGRAALNLGRPAMAGNGDIAGELLAALQDMEMDPGATGGPFTLPVTHRQTFFPGTA